MKRGLYDCLLRHLPNMHAIQAGQAQIRETKGGIATPAGSHTGDFLEKVHDDAMLHADGQIRSLKKMLSSMLSSMNFIGKASLYHRDDFL